jgi:hypothetical protein
MPTRVIRGLAVVAHGDVLLSERSMLVTAMRLLYGRWSRQPREQYYTQHGSATAGKNHMLPASVTSLHYSTI